MVILLPEVKDLFSKIKVFPVATASKSGVPNVVPIGFCVLKDDETIWIADNFMQKTLANVKENPSIALYLYSAELKQCYQLKGSARVVTDGPDFLAMKEMVHKLKPTLPAKTLFIMTITEVYQCNPGPDAGKKIQ